MNLVRITAASLVSLLATALLAIASDIPVPWHDGDEAMLRLSLRARPERMEHCRAPSRQELEQMAEHMRQRLICDGTTASYLLRVSIDGNQVDSQVVRGGGLRNDRPLQVLSEYGVAPGTRRLAVTIERRETPNNSGDHDMTIESDPDSGTFAGRARREAGERERSRRVAIPSLLTLDTLIAVEPRTVILVSFDPDTRSLRLPPGTTP